jgi:hypothetical protein
MTYLVVPIKRTNKASSNNIFSYTIKPGKTNTHPYTVDNIGLHSTLTHRSPTSTYQLQNKQASFPTTLTTPHTTATRQTIKQNTHSKPPEHTGSKHTLLTQPHTTGTHMISKYQIKTRSESGYGTPQDS